MSKSIKNREGVLPVGTIVKPAFDKFTAREGEVLGHSEDGERMLIKWDDQPYPSGYFMPAEIRRAD